MNTLNFDELTKALASSPSRRHVLRTIVTASIGGLIGLTSIGTVFGRRRPKCHRNGLGCDQDSQCCSGYCENQEKCACPPFPACNDSCPCSSGQCQSGTCVGAPVDCTCSPGNDHVTVCVANCGVDLVGACEAACAAMGQVFATFSCGGPPCPL